jgi:hypothetical protein
MKIKLLTILCVLLATLSTKAQDSLYANWRKTINEMLEKTKDYATKPEDCYRFVLGKPIEKGYKQAETIMGDLRRKEQETEQ